MYRPFDARHGYTSLGQSSTAQECGTFSLKFLVAMRTYLLQVRAILARVQRYAQSWIDPPYPIYPRQTYALVRVRTYSLVLGLFFRRYSRSAAKFSLDRRCTDRA